MRQVVTYLVLIASLVACQVPATTGRISGQSIRLNKVVENVHNKILLLNVVRASKRLPRHWSAITTVRDVENVSIGTGGISIPFGGGANSHEYGASPSFSTSGTPSMEMAVQVSAEFTRGIMQGLELEQIKYFLDQGWPPGFVFTLCIRSIEVADKDGKNPVPVSNRPDGNTGYKGFREFELVIDHLVRNNLRVQEPKGTDECCRAIDLCLESPSELESLLKMGYKVTASAPGRVRAIAPGPKGLVLIAGSGEEADAKQDGSRASFLVSDGNQTKRYTITLRSPEGVIYYLGQLLRANNNAGGALAHYTDKNKRYSLFEARSISEDEDALVKVEHDGAWYGIVDGGNDLDRSMMTFNFASILMNLNRKRKDLPTTSVVQVGGL